MSKKDEEFFLKLLAVFQLEAAEHLKDIADGLLRLEKQPAGGESQALIEGVFRQAHSLKGSARAVDRTDIASLCQSLEDIFAAWKRGETPPPSAQFDVLYRALDWIEHSLGENGSGQSGDLVALLGELEHMKSVPRSKHGKPSANTEQGQTSEDGVAQTRVSDFGPGGAEDGGPGEQAEIKTAPGAPPPVVPEAGPQDRRFTRIPEKNAQSQTVRISTSKLDTLFLQIEELLVVKLKTSQHVTDLKATLAFLEGWDKEWARLSPEVRKARRHPQHPAQENGRSVAGGMEANALAFLEWNARQVSELKERLIALTKAAEEDRRELGGLVDSLLDDMKQALMLPFASLLDVLPRMVRDLGREQKKDVDLDIRGAEIEIDRRILEEMKDPVIHMVRNCIDHGLEASELRARLGKPKAGSIRVSVTQADSRNILLCIEDDGAGIDIEQVKSSAIRRGIVSKEAAERLEEQEALMLIFQSGVSTSPIVTDISGRGLGMAIVQEKVSNLGGRIRVENRPGAGLAFKITLPITLATFRGVLLKTAGRTFLVPTINVERVLRVPREQVRTVEGKATIPLDGRAVPLVELAAVLGLAGNEKQAAENSPHLVLVLGVAENCVGFQVDQMLYEQEVLVKSLGKQLSRLRNISGATILGTGEIVPILHVTDLIKTALEATGPMRTHDSQEEHKEPARRILVVEDSITTRTLLKNILQSAGYQVQTAVDGVDALTALRTTAMDLVVSDIEMPRMNGFDLTMEIRQDKQLAELPVVLVTSLESREDRERGIDVGADAYIVKSGFDQANLLQTIQKWV